LKIADFNFKSQETRIAPGVSKTGVSRTLPLSPVTVQAVKMLIACRHKQWAEDVPVFCSAEGTPFRNDTWGDRLEVYGKELGVKIHPYALRHTFATLFLRAGGNAIVLQRLVGHSTLQMTTRHTHLTEKDLREVHAVASPVNGLASGKCRMRGLR
jgi:integrase